MRLRTLLAVLGTVLVVAPSVQATPYWSPEDIRARNESLEPVLDMGPNEFLRWSSRDQDYFLEYQRVVDFVTSLQVLDPEHPHYGGLREAEHMLDVIQTDNTSEFIWVLCRYREMTSDTQYDDRVQAAWEYEMNFPAYDEEGSDNPTTGYYRVYNCAWAVRAEMKYRHVYGDATYLAYGDSCASYLCHHNLQLTIDPTYMIINPTVLAWAAGNLYAYGLDRANPDFLYRGMKRGNRVKGWADDDSLLLGKEAWAMSGGSIMWGVLNSYYLEYPESTQIWADALGPYMDTYSDPGEFQNAWNAWYSLGHLAAGEALDDPNYLQNHAALVDTLLFEDADDDGGIPAKPADADTMDHAWIANYQAYMGLNPLIDLTGTALARAFDGPNVILQGNWPNPFNPSTTIGLDMLHPGYLRLQIYDVKGRLVRTLFDGRSEAGERSVLWDGVDDRGLETAPGVYFLRLTAGKSAMTQKMILIE